MIQFIQSNQEKNKYICEKPKINLTANYLNLNILLKNCLSLCLTDELEWLKSLHNALVKRKDTALISWVTQRISIIETKIKKLNEQ